MGTPETRAEDAKPGLEGAGPGVLARGLVRQERGEEAVSSKEGTGKRMGGWERGETEGYKKKLLSYNQ